MRAKQIWDYVPLPRKSKLMWNRITTSRLTTAYFIFSLIHCIIQVALQIRAFTINANALTFLYGLSVEGNATDDRVPVLGTGGTTISLCPDVPYSLGGMNGCDTLWGAKNGTEYGGMDSSFTSILPSSTVPSITDAPTGIAASGFATTSGVGNFGQASIPNFSPDPSSAAPATVTIFVTPDGEPIDAETAVEILDTRQLSKRNVQLTPILGEGNVTFALNGDGFDDVVVTKNCLWALNWPVGILANTKREDIVFIAFQFWVLGMSVVALLNESIPHIFASLLTHVLAAGWGAFQISHTANFRANFNKVITNGACTGAPLLPRYWDERSMVEFPSMGLNIAALLLSCWFTWKLVKLFGWQTFKRVGASLTINRMYKLVLVLSITLQLSLFFMAAAVSLWIDNLFNGVAATTVWYVTLYKATSFATALLLIPWLMTGWFAVRKEMRVPMAIFLLLSILYLAGWGVMFLADTFRWTYMTWLFFAMIATAGIVLTVLSLVLGIICRYNFGRGLPRYLHGQEPLPGDSFQPIYSPSDLEKVDFPSKEKPIPTYSAAFGKGPEVPPPSQMFGGRMGPRFFNNNAEPFESPRNLSPISVPPSALTRTLSNDSSPGAGGNMARSDTQKSFGSIASFYSYSPTDNSHSRNNSQDARAMMSGNRRWVIE